MITPTYLAKKNEHVRDKRIQFFEEGHRYLVNGEGGFTSTTTYIHSLFSHFDSDGIISGILKKKDWSDNPDYKYYRMSAKDISDMWKKNGELASSAGTKMHYNIECYFNNMQYEVDLQKGDSFAISLADEGDVAADIAVMDVVVAADEGEGEVAVDVADEGEGDYVVFPPVVDDGSPEYKYFLNFVKGIVMEEELEPYRTEMLVYDESVRITGSIDMLYRKKNGEFAIFDWKRSKEILFEGFRGKKSPVKCIGHLNDCNFWHYSLQLNIYRRILQTNYGMTVTDLRLVILHPDNSDYMCLVVPFLDKEIDSLFAMRQNEFKNNG
jgi:hypothetical protein